jgi:NhaC family Na+:H+ antiporter
MYAVSLIAIAMSYGGIMDKSRMLEVIVDKLIQWFVKGARSLVTTTVFVTIASNIAFAEQYVGVILPTKMFARTYRKRGYHPKMLSGAVDGTGTLTSPLIPWNTCGIAMAGFLGVTAWQFAPFAFFNWLVPIVTIGLAMAGKYERFLKDDPTTVTSAYEEAFKDEPLPENLKANA